MDVKKLTLREALQAFDEQRHKAGAKKYAPTKAGYTRTAKTFEKYFGGLMNKPGGAMILFTPNDTGEFPASILFKRMHKNNITGLKNLMQETRYLGADFLRKNLPRGDESINVLPQMDTDKIEEFFGVPEPPKGVSDIIPNSNPEAHGKFLVKLEEYKQKNPAKKAVVDAIILNLVQGVRPAVAQQLDVSENYDPKRMILRIPGEGQGAKGTAFSTPLSDYADLLIQENIKNNKKNNITNKRVFNILGKNNKYRPINDTDVLKVLGEINIVISGELDPTTGIIRGQNAEGILTDPEQIDPVTGTKGVTYASYNPPQYEGRRSGGKFGAQLMRNLNTDAGAGVIDPIVSAIIQGRDVKQVYIGKQTGAMSSYVGYQRDPFRSFTDFDNNPDQFRQGANTIVNNLFKSANMYGGLDLSTTYFGQLSGKTAASRVTGETLGYSEYFKKVVKEPPAISEKNIATSNATQPSSSILDATDTVKDKLKELGFNISKGKNVIAGAISLPTAAKIAGAFVGGATTTVPIVAEAVVSEAFSPSPMGKEEIDPLTGESYRIATGPESRNLSEEEILKRSRMAKGQLELSQGQKTLLRGATQKYMIDKTKGQSVETGTDTFDKTQLGQSIITGSDNPNFLNMEENNAGK